MAALTITAISLGEDAVTERVEFAEAVGLAKSVYKDADAAGKWRLANNSSEAEAGKDGIGITLHAAQADGEWGEIVTGGTVHMLSDLVKGKVYVVGDADGEITASDDATIGSGDYITTLGIGGATTGTSDDFLMQVQVGGVTE